MFKKNGVEYTTKTECLDWRYSAAILGLIKFYKYCDRMDYNLSYDYDEDFIYYNVEDITEERFLEFAEDCFGNDMHHKFVESELANNKEFTNDSIKKINERLLGNTTLKKYFAKNKFDGNNVDEILDLINKNRQEIIRETFRNKTNLYRNYNNTNSLFSEEKDNCRVLGYCIDMPKKGKSLSYNFNTATLVARDNVIFDFIPFGFVIGSDSLFINNNASIHNLEITNDAVKSKLRYVANKQNRELENLNPKNILFNMVVESSDYIDYDVEVIIKKRVNEYFETLYIRKESIEIFRCIKKNIKDFSCFAKRYRVNDNYYIDIQDKVIDAVLNLTNVIDIIQMLLKDDTSNRERKYGFIIDQLIKVNVMITGGIDMYQDKEKAINSAKGCAFRIIQNDLMKANDGSKIKTYRTKLASALAFKDYRKFYDILMQLANYLSIEINFAYNLFLDFEKNEYIAYAFVNGLGASGNNENKDDNAENKEEV